MTKEIEDRIALLVEENMGLKQIAAEAEEKMRANRLELGRIMKEENVEELQLEHATLKLVTTRTATDFDYLKNLPGYRHSKLYRRVACVPYATIGKPKS